MSRLVDRTGHQYGRLTALTYLGNGQWLCRCRCGRQTVVRACNLHSGNSRSCGCLNREHIIRANEARWERYRAEHPRPLLSRRPADYTVGRALSPTTVRALAYRLACVARNDARAATDEGEALAAFRCVAKVYPYLAPVLAALPAENVEAAA